MTYNDAEIKTSVSTVVGNRKPYRVNGLGSRNVQERFEATRELVYSTLLYESDSVFYLIYKANLQALSSLRSLLSLYAEVEADLSDMAVSPKPVRDTQGVVDAVTALDNASRALTRRGSIGEVEYRRYSKAVDRALDRFKESARRTYKPFGSSTAVTDVVRSSAEASSELVASFSAFKAAYLSFLTTINTLNSAFDNYSHSNTVRQVAAKQVARAKAELSALASRFNSSSPEVRAKTARADTLKLLTNRASIKALARVRAPEEPKLQQLSSATSLYRIQANGTGTAPSIAGSVSGPWPVQDSSSLGPNGHELLIDFGVAPPITVRMIPAAATAVQGVQQASVTGVNASSPGSSFAIGADLATPHPLLTKNIATGGQYTLIGTFLYLMVDGVPLKISDDALSSPPTIAFSANRSAANLAADINFHAGAYVTASAQTDGISDWVQIEYTRATPPATYRNRYIQAASGANHSSTFDGTWRVDVAGVPAAGSLSTGWDANDELRIWPNDVAVPIAVSLPVGAWPNYIVSAATVAAAIDASSTEYSAAADANNRVVITSTERGEGSIIRIVTQDGVFAKKPASLLGAETLGFYKDQENRQFDVSTRAILEVLNSNTDFSALAIASLEQSEVYSAKRCYASAANTLSVEVDSDPSASWTPSELKLEVLSGENTGIYGISSVNYASPVLSFALDRNLRDVGALGVQVRVYEDRLRITAKSSSISSYIDIGETHPNSAHTVLGLSSSLTRGTVEQLLVQTNDPTIGWTSADLRGLGISVGDRVLEEDGTLIGYVTDMSSLSNGLLGVTAISPTTSYTAFSIESSSAVAHTAFKQSLDSWLEDLSDEGKTLKELTRLVTTVTKSPNPTVGMVQSAATALQSLQSTLTALQSILTSFEVPSVPAVDRALELMSEGGEDRARKLLTSGQFSEFEETDYRTSSSSGALQQAMRQVAIEDFVAPTRTQREFEGEITRERFSEVAAVDPQYDFSDIRPDVAPLHLDYFAQAVPEKKR